MGVGRFCGDVCDGMGDICNGWEFLDKSDNNVCVDCGNRGNCGDFEWE